MSINETLAAIPVKIQGGPAPNYHWKRRLIQIVTLLVFILIPLTGLFRIDLQAGYFVILDRQVWWSDFALMLGFWTMLATGAVMTYSTVGTVWCGWACPQNTLSEWTNYLTHNLLGKRASVRIDSEKSRIAAAKNKPLNWLVLMFSMLATSLVLAIVPFLYLYPTDAIWSMITFRPDPRLPKFTHLLYFVFVFAAFLNIALIRHILCRYFCLYRMWQHLFKTKKTLHVEYDASRSADCAKCNYCETSCFLDLDPTQFKIYDSCINCGECIDACDRLHAREGKRGLLRFEFGERRLDHGWRDSVDNLASRLGWTGVLFAVGLGLFVWGFATYSPYAVAASRVVSLANATTNEYQIQVSNKVYAPAEVALSIQGLPEGSYHLQASTVNIAPSARADVDLSLSPSLSKGLHRIIIEARATNGWSEKVVLEHYASGTP
ncbi:MAG: 4Fe-4S binding protein [Gallionellaceae bacterium]|jgi:polyferredoxin|nr:4Fe-4S binding protein [Gallionellaceae bacterium]